MRASAPVSGSVAPIRIPPAACFSATAPPCCGDRFSLHAAARNSSETSRREGAILVISAFMAYAQRIHRTGGPEVMQWEDVEVGAPGAGEVRIRQTAVGVNFIDVYQRTGLYALPLPFVPGQEGAGVVSAVGTGV